MLKRLEAQVSSSHTVAQFVFVPQERHEAHIGLDLNGLVKDQHAIGFPGNRLQGVDFLCCILQLFTKLFDISESSEDIADLSHGVVRECDEGEVGGEGVPPGGKGRLSQPVPEDSHPFSVSLQQGALWEAEGAVGDAVHKVKRDPLHLVTVEHHEVVLEDQEREFCDENNALLFIVPVIHFCHQPNAENAAIYLLIHQSFNVFDGLIQSARP